MIFKKLFSLLFLFLISISSLIFFKNNNSLSNSNNQIKLKYRNKEDEISEDIRKFNENKYNEFIYTKDQKLISKKIINHDLNQKIRFRIQYQNIVSENWCEWISNSLNENSSELSLINFNQKDVDFINLINKEIYHTVLSIYPRENLYKYRMPRIAKEVFGYPYFPEPASEYQQNTVNIFGTPQENPHTHKISRYSANGSKSIYSSHWYYANDIYDTLKYHNEWDIHNFFRIQKFQKESVINNSFQLDNYFYKLIPETFKTKEWGYSYSGGKISGYLDMFDNSNNEFQKGSNRKRTFNDWFSNNYSDYILNDDPTNRKLGNKNITNNLTNIEIDFSNLIKVDKKTSNFLNNKNDIHKTSPKIYFNWNTDLLDALKELKLIKDILFNYLKQTKIDNWSKIYKINNLLLNIYNYELDSLELQALFDNDFNYDEINKLSKKQHYFKLLKYNWLFKEDIQLENINNNKINIDLLKIILNRAIAYEYVIPKLFSNDIWIEYLDINTNKSNYFKIYDKNKYNFVPIIVDSKNNQLETFDNIVEFKIKNIYMYNKHNNLIISGSEHTKNNSLNLINISNISKKQNIKYNNEDKTLNFIFLFNTTNFDSPIVDNESNQISKVNLLVSDIFILQKEDIMKLTLDILKIPNEIIKKYDNVFDGLIDKIASFNDPDLNNLEAKNFKDIENYLKLKNNYWKNKNLLKENKISEDDYLKSKFELDSLGYFYLDLSIAFPLHFYMTLSDYSTLIKNKIIIERNRTITGNYRYWIKYSTNKKPLKISDLEKYIKINYFDSNNEFEKIKSEIKNYLNTLSINEFNLNLIKNEYQTISNDNNIEIINKKFDNLIRNVIDNLEIKKVKHFKDWYKFKNEVLINFDFKFLKNKITELLSERNNEIYEYLLNNKNEYLVDFINNLENHNELLTKQYNKIENKFEELNKINKNLLLITNFLNAFNEFNTSKTVSINLDINQILQDSNNTNNISKYWILNMNNLNEIFYVSKQTFTNEFNNLLDKKTKLKFNLNKDNLFSFNFENKSNEYIFQNLKLNYIYELNEETKLLDALSLIFNKNELLTTNNKQLNDLFNEIKKQLNKLTILNNELLESIDKINYSFYENYIINEYSLDNNKYYKNIIYKINNLSIIKKYEINWILILIISILILSLLLTIFIIIIKKNKRVSR